MPFVRRFSIRGAFIVAFFVLLWIGLWSQLSGEWSVNDQYSYGWFVPFFAVVLFWIRFEDAPEAPKLGAGSLELGQRKTENRSQRSEVGAQTNNKQRITNNAAARTFAIAIVVAAVLLLFPIRLFEIGNPDWRPLGWLHAICIVTITLVFLWLVGGKPWLRHFAFPVAFTLIAVPWVTPTEEPIVQGL